MVKKRPLGTTGMTVSEIAFGAVEIGMLYGIGIESETQMLSEEQAIALIHEAMAHGINFFDTARQYGKSEAILGKAFTGRRKEVIIATKCRHLRRTNGNIPNAAALGKIIKTSLEESLAALQTDYVDVFMLHDGDEEILQHPIVQDTFRQLKSSGIIRAAGISTYTPGETDMALHSGFWEVVQVPFNLLDQRQARFFKVAHERGVGIVARSVLLKGVLTERGKQLHSALYDVAEHIRKYESLQTQTQTDLSTLATKFALSFENISSVLLGIDKQDYLERAIRTVNGRYLKDNELEQALALQYKNPEFLNLYEWNKNGWLK